VRIWHGRHAEPLIIIWGFALVLAAILYKIDAVQPALAVLFRPVYMIIAGIALLLTWKWFRERAGGKRHDRRHADRRQDDRRDDTEPRE